MIGCYGLSVVLALMAGFVPHTGPLTAQQFADNYNFLARYNGDPAYLLQPDGSWAESDPYSYVVDFSGGPLPMTIETGADGFVESVTLREEWDRETFLAFWPEYDMQLVSIAFGAGEGAFWMGKVLPDFSRSGQGFAVLHDHQQNLQDGPAGPC